MRLNNVITKSIVTEKSTREAAEGRYTFRVNVKATKGKIKNEIQNLFGVTVIGVKTLIIPGKKRAIRGAGRKQFTKTAMFKKAIVQLKDGEKIELYD